MISKKLTDKEREEIVKKIQKRISNGYSVGEAAKAEGISESTYQNWKIAFMVFELRPGKSRSQLKNWIDEAAEEKHMQEIHEILNNSNR